MCRYCHSIWKLPLQFFINMLDIVEQEANHFLSWKTHLETHYYLKFGTLPVSEGLWKDAILTAGKTITLVNY